MKQALISAARPPLGQRLGDTQAFGRHPISRAAFAAFAGAASLRQGSAENVARELWPHDTATHGVLMRGTMGAIDTSDVVVLDDTASLGAWIASLPGSAASRLIAAGLTVPLAQDSPMNFPSRTGTPSGAQFIGESDAIPVVEYDITGSTLGPTKKLGAIVVGTRELLRRPAAEAIFNTLLAEDAALGLDTVMFGDDDGDADQPAGLLHGVAPIAGYAGGDELAMRTDLKALAGAVAAGGGSGRLAFVANPLQAATIAFDFPDMSYPVWASSAIPAGRVIALDPGAFVFGGDAVPLIEASRGAVLHMDDDPDVDLTDGPASPVRSMFQTDSVALRLTFWAGWTMRASGRVAVVEGATW